MTHVNYQVLKNWNSFDSWGYQLWNGDSLFKILNLLSL